MIEEQLRHAIQVAGLANAMGFKDGCDTITDLVDEVRDLNSQLKQMSAKLDKQQDAALRESQAE